MYMYIYIYIRIMCVCIYIYIYINDNNNQAADRERLAASAGTWHAVTNIHNDDDNDYSNNESNTYDCNNDMHIHNT